MGRRRARRLFLRELGFHGKTRIMIKDSTDLDDAFSREVLSLIHELYTNIAVHGSPGGEYRLIVFWDDDNLIHVDQVNDVSSKTYSLTSRGLETVCCCT